MPKANQFWLKVLTWRIFPIGRMVKEIYSMKDHLSTHSTLYHSRESQITNKASQKSNYQVEHWFSSTFHSFDRSTGADHSEQYRAMWSDLQRCSLKNVLLQPASWRQYLMSEAGLNSLQIRNEGRASSTIPWNVRAMNVRICQAQTLGSDLDISSLWTRSDEFHEFWSFLPQIQPQRYVFQSVQACTSSRTFGEQE